MDAHKRLTIGLFGFGVVGEGLYRILQQTPSLKASIKKVCIKHPGKKRNAPEDLFTELFSQVFGLEMTLLLVHEYPARDIYDGNRFVDYALRTRDEKVAFEIDGLTWHLPDATSVPSASST